MDKIVIRSEAMEGKPQATSEKPGGEGDGNKDEGSVEGADKHEAFAMRILEEPDSREKVLLVLGSLARNMPRKKAEEILENLAGRKSGGRLEARAIVTLYRIVQGAEYPQFMSDLLHTSCVFERLGFHREAAILMIFGLRAFGAHSLNPQEHRDLNLLLRLAKNLRIRKAFRDIIDDYFNKTLEPRLEMYRKMRLVWLERLRGRPSRLEEVTQAILIAILIALGGMIALSNIPVISQRTEEAVRLALEEERLSKDARSQSSAKKSGEQPLSLARKICGQTGARTTKGFLLGERQVRVACGVEENEPFLEIAERVPPTENAPERITICVDTDRNDTPDNCGTNMESSQTVRMVAPPQSELDGWFQRVLQDVANKMQK